MQIFYLHSNPYICATLYGDKHVAKQILEAAQMLSTAHHILSPETDNSALYKLTHQHHPVSVWVRENSANYQWTYQLLKALCEEFTLRRSKRHATARLLPLLCVTPRDMPNSQAISKPALAMPDIFKVECPVESYRRYYRQKYADWLKGDE